MSDWIWKTHESFHGPFAAIFLLSMWFCVIPIIAIAVCIDVAEVGWRRTVEYVRETIQRSWMSKREV